MGKLYQIRFKDEFELPIFSGDMLYKFIANLTQEEINFSDHELTIHSVQIALMKDFALKLNFVIENIKFLKNMELSNLL
jgi:hypothetical protein